MTWRIPRRYGPGPSSNRREIPEDPTLVLTPYLASGGGTESFLLDRPLRHRVPRQWWNGDRDPGSIYVIAEVTDMPVITGEDPEDFKGFPFNVCFYAGCVGFQTEAFFDDLRASGCEPPWEPWFMWGAMHGGHSTPVFQLDTDTEDAAKVAAQATVPWVEDHFMRLMRVPVNRMGSHGWDWLRGDLVSRPRLATLSR